MAVNKEILAKGIKYMVVALPLFFIGPVVLNSAFKNQQHPYYYLVLVIAILVCFSAITLTFIGVKTITNAIFDGNK